MLTNSVPRPDGKPCTKISSDLWGNEILNGGLPPVSPTLLVEGHGVLPLSVLLLPGIVPEEKNQAACSSGKHSDWREIRTSPVFAVKEPAVPTSGAHAPPVVHHHLENEIQR